MAVDYNKFLSGLLIAFIGLIVGIVFLSELSTLIVANTQPSTLTLETIAITSGSGATLNERMTIVSDAAPITNERITTISDASPISKEGMTIFSGTNTTVNANIINVTFFGNHTINTSTDLANLSENVNFTIAGVITVNDNIFNDSNGTGVLYNITYTYAQNSSNSTVNANVINVTFFGNQTVNTSIDSVNLSRHINFTRVGLVTVSPATFGDSLYNITYTYEQNSTNTTVNRNVVSVTFFGNQTVNTSQDSANVTAQVNFTRGGNITVSPTIFGQSLYNISYTTVANSTGNTANGNVTSVTFFGNTTTNTTQASVTVGTEINFSRRGNINVTPTVFADGNYQITYTFEGLTYIADTTTRMILPLIPIFFALFVFLFGVVLVLQSGITEGFQ